jgi:hypothetical protein
MFRIHCFSEDNCEKYGLLFPENTYETKNMDKVISTMKDVLDTNESGISKIVIEKDIFSVNTQSPMIID